jgi:hypothetical protein
MGVRYGGSLEGYGACYNISSMHPETVARVRALPYDEWRTLQRHKVTMQDDDVR